MTYRLLPGYGLPRPRKFWIVSSGTTFSGCGNELPKLISATPWRYSARPSEATTLPSGAAWRRGRNTRKCAASPNPTAIRQRQDERCSQGPGAAVGQGDLDRDVQAFRGQEVDPREEELAAIPRGVEGEQAVHGHGAVAEVDDARALVGDDEAGAEHCVERTEAEPDEQSEDDVVQRVAPGSRHVMIRTLGSGPILGSTPTRAGVQWCVFSG